MPATRRSLLKSLRHFRDRLRSWQERSREPGLTALLIVEASLIFIAVPLASMGVLPEMIVPALFVLLVIAILVVTSRSHVAAGVVIVVAVALDELSEILLEVGLLEKMIPMEEIQVTLT